MTYKNLYGYILDTLRIGGGKMEMKVIPQTRNLTRKIPRVCAYCRVSTKSDEQLNSYELQKAYWEGKLKDNPKYEFVGIFADHGVSARTISKRPECVKMLELAKRGEIDIIFVKSISRFSRNTVYFLT